MPLFHLVYKASNAMPLPVDVDIDNVAVIVDAKQPQVILVVHDEVFEVSVDKLDPHLDNEPLLVLVFDKVIIREDLLGEVIDEEHEKN